jgi:PKD repeat protein
MRSLFINPAPNQTGTATISVTVTAGGQSMTDTFLLTVNTSPLAVPQSVETDEDMALSIALTADDPDGQALTFSIVAAPQHGTLTGTAPNLLYTPELNYHGPDSFDFTVSDGLAVSAPATVSINVLSVNDAPVADAKGPYDTNLGEGITLDGTASFDIDSASGDSIVSYAWSIAGGAYLLSGAMPSLSTAQIDALGVGTFPVALTVTDEFGATGTATTNLSVFDNRPVASFTATPTFAAPGQNVTFDASASTHGRPDRQIVSYSWDFGDGSTATGVTTTHAFTAFGTYTVTLTVTDNNNPPKTATASANVSVNQGNNPPVAVPNGPYSVNLGEGLTLSSNGSFDPDIAAGDSIVSYSWEIQPGVVLSGPSPSLDANQINNLAILVGVGVEVTVRLTVTDTFGATGTATTTLAIYDNRPFASLSANPNPAAPAQAITFDASASSHGRSIDRSIVQYAFDFGDGTSYTETAGNAPDGLFDGKTTHAYGLFGTFTADVTVTDNNVPAKTDTATQVINVNQGNRAPTANPGGPYNVALGSGITLDGSASADPDATFGDSIVSYAWTIENRPGALDGVMPSLSAADIAALSPGSFAVFLTVTDEFGATGSAQSVLNINDGTAPTFTSVPSNVVVEATGPAGAVATYPEATATDDVDDPADIAIVYSHASGALFPLGTTTVIVTATDTAGNTASSSFNVIVRDTTPPIVAAPADITVEATSAGGAVVTFTPAATDLVATPTIVSSPASGSQFSLGTTTVQVTATDAAGNSSQASFNVTVVDTTAPTLTVPADITVEAISPAGAIVTFAATATDAVDAQPTFTLSPASGSQFPLGETTVNVTATDDAGNTASGTFKVFVVDTTGPTIVLPPDQTFEATSAAGAVVNFSEATTPGETSTITYQPANGSQFPLGTTTVLVTANDSLGNESTGTFTLTVVDTTAPTLTLPADITVEATSPIGAIVTFSATATDAVDSDPTITHIPASGSQFPLGVTTVNVSATDDAGNASTGSFTVTVVEPAPSGPITTVNVINGQLVIEGDDGINVVTVTGVGTGTGVYDVTTEQGTQRFSGVNGGISIDLAGGGDELTLNNVYVAGGIDIQTGDGDDTVVLGDNDVVSSGQDLRIDLGAGNDTIDGLRLYIGGNQIVQGGDGDDRLIFEGFASPQFTLGTSAAGFAFWAGGSGNDTVRVVYAFIVGAWGIYLGDGMDSLNVFGSAVSGDVVFSGDNGDDTLTVDTNFFDATHVIQGLAGTDTVLLANGLGSEFTSIVTGDGNDRVTVRNQTTNHLHLDTGAGNDELEVRSSAFDLFFALLGNDSDRLTVHGNLSRQQTDLDGGLGVDALVDLGNSFFGTYNARGFEA